MEASDRENEQNHLLMMAEENNSEENANIIEYDRQDDNEIAQEALFQDEPIITSEAAVQQQQQQQQQQPPNLRTLISLLLFFICGLGSSIGYISTLSCLVYFQMNYGSNSFVYLNLAVYIPLLPISIAQAKYDQHYDIRYTSLKMFWFRGIAGFTFCIVGSLLILLFLNSYLWILLLGALLQGTGGAVLLGMLNQMSAFVNLVVPTNNNNNNNDISNENIGKSPIQATVSAGVQASAVVVLFVSIATGFVRQDKGIQSNIVWFLIVITIIQTLSLLMFITLMSCQPAIRHSMQRRDSVISLRLLDDNDNDQEQQQRQQQQQQQQTSLITSSPGPLLQRPSRRQIISSNNNEESLQQPLLQQQSASSISDGSIDEQRSQELTFASLWYFTRTNCQTLLLTLIPSFLVGSWFTHVQTNWTELPQVLFYTRIGSDFIGRLITIIARTPSSVNCLYYTSLLRLVLVTYFFYLHSGLRKNNDNNDNNRNNDNDMITISLVAIIAFLSGYLVTLSFQLAPTTLPHDVRTANLAKQASLLNVFFSVSALFGLLSSFALLFLLGV